MHTSHEFFGGNYFRRWLSHFRAWAVGTPSRAKARCVGRPFARLELTALEDRAAPGVLVAVGEDATAGVLPEVADAAPPSQEAAGPAAVQRVFVAPEVPLIYSTPLPEEAPAPTRDSETTDERDDEAPTETEEAKEPALQVLDRVFAALFDGLNDLQDALADVLPSSDAEEDGGGIGILPSDGATSEAASGAVASSDAGKETTSQPATPSASGDTQTDGQALFEALLTQGAGIVSAMLAQAGVFSQTTGAALPSADAALPSSLSSKSSEQSQAAAALGQLALRFEQNVGQFDTSVDFVVRGSGYEAGLSATGATYVVSGASPETGELTSFAVQMSVIGANPNAAGAGVGQLSGYTNYLVGDDPSQHFTGVASYGSVTYQDVYAGTDLVYYSAPGKQLEYDFVLAPGADVSAIRLRFDGAESVRLDQAGNLVLDLGGREVTQYAPVVYQVGAGGSREAVAGRYTLDGDHVGFEVGAYDLTRQLVLDPIIYASYLGAEKDDRIEDVSVDANGNMFVVGSTRSSLLAVTNGTALLGETDAFIAKINPQGTQLLYCTYLGGLDNDWGNNITLIDGVGGAQAVVTGSTNGQNFPTVQAVQPNYGGGDRDAFVTVLNAQGGVSASTYIGGPDDEDGRGITKDAAGAFYVAGITDSNQLFANANQFAGGVAVAPVLINVGGFGGYESWVAKLVNGVSQYGYIARINGANDDFANAIGVDNTGRAVVVGTTQSNLSQLNPFQPLPGGMEDAFVTMIAANGTGFVYSSNHGGTLDESGEDIVVLGDGTAYIVGTTSSFNMPITPNAFQQAKPAGPGIGDRDAYVAVVIPPIPGPNASCTYSTYLGESEEDWGFGISLTLQGQIAVVGKTYSANFPITATAIQPAKPNPAPGGGGVPHEDGYLTVLTPVQVPGPNGLLYSTYWGGFGHYTGPRSVAVDALDRVFMGGFTKTNTLTSWSNGVPGGSFQPAASVIPEGFVFAHQL